MATKKKPTVSATHGKKPKVAVKKPTSTGKTGKAVNTKSQKKTPKQSPGWDQSSSATTETTPAAKTPVVAPLPEIVAAATPKPVEVPKVEEPNPFANLNFKETAEELDKTKAKVAVLQTDLGIEQTRLINLNKRFVQLHREMGILGMGDFSGLTADQSDGRKKVIPERNVKISAGRAVEHAKKAGRSPEEAYERAMEVVQVRSRYWKLKEPPSDIVPYVKKKVEKLYQTA